jgi:DNA-binding CsgD family transcriptional regulator
MNKTSVVYGLILGLLLIGFKALEFYFFSYKITLETYLGIVAGIFLILGLYVGWRFSRVKVSEKIIYVPHNEVHPKSTLSPENSFQDLGLSDREYEVLTLLNQGCSNQEIADRLYISLSTVKTHISNIFLKLDVKRRTQAISKAKELKIIS